MGRDSGSSALQREANIMLSKALDLAVKTIVPMSLAEDALSKLDTETPIDDKIHHLKPNKIWAMVKRQDGTKDGAGAGVQQIVVPYEMPTIISDFTMMLIVCQLVVNSLENFNDFMEVQTTKVNFIFFVCVIRINTLTCIIGDN